MAGDATEHKHRLKLKGRIGNGAFGDIHKGVMGGETVAVKTMTKPSADAREVCSAMFFSEAQMLRSCDHKRIIGYRALLKLPPADPSSQQPVWALVMEYAKSGNLSQRVCKQMVQPGLKAYDNIQALTWALDVAGALEYLHLRTPAVLHRDVKSANIMLTSEEGALVAKLSDFGLHVIADSSRYKAQQSSSFSVNGPSAVKEGQAGARSITVEAATPSHSSAGPSKTPDSSNHTNDGSSSSSGGGTAGQEPPDPTSTRPPAWQPSQLLHQHQQVQHDHISSAAASNTAAAAAEDHHTYSEVHDSSGGSKVFVEANNSAVTGSSTVTNRHRPARRNSSFRRAAHHPPGEALPRVTLQGPKPGSLDMEAAADANAYLFTQMRVAGAGSGGDEQGWNSVCSLASEGTWATEGTAVSGTDTAGSDCTEDTAGSIYEEFETVFDMTGNTGSCLYMAPEVYRNECYNEKSDVFSFGVVLYELLARVLVVFTELPQHTTDPTSPQKYAAKVAGGYRPSRPKSVPEPLWALVTACWKQDPLLRPHMSEVVAVLSSALADAQAQQQSSRRRRVSFGLSGTSPGQSTVEKFSASASGAGSDQAHSTTGKGSSCASVVPNEDAEAAPPPPPGCGCVIG